MKGDPEYPRSLHPAVIECSRLAVDLFQDNHRLSFVAGSHARGTASSKSDVDLMLIINKPDRDREVEFCRAFSKIHHQYSLDLEHFGEVFDLATILYLVNATEIIESSAPEILNSGCYHGDCLFSVFRKGDIVLKFFDDARVCVRGDHDLLEDLSARAVAYFAQSPTIRKQLAKRQLVFSDDAIRELFASRLPKTESETVHSPAGIGLERWFRADYRTLLNASSYPDSREKPAQGRQGIAMCPLDSFGSHTRQRFIIRSQCLLSDSKEKTDA